MQGRLRDEPVAVEIETVCRHCEQVLHVTIDSQMRVAVQEADAAPLVFMPDVDWSHFAERTIIDAY